MTILNSNTTIADLLLSLTREELRDCAKKHGVKRGKNKQDTIENIVKSGKVKIIFYLDRRNYA